MNGFGSMVLRPCGLMVPKRKIHILSFLFLSNCAWSEWEGAFIKSKM